MSVRVWATSDQDPGYKDIHAVMDAQRDLCQAVEELTAVVNFKGTR